jgi:hypothetical protein
MKKVEKKLLVTKNGGVRRSGYTYLGGYTYRAGCTYRLLNQKRKFLKTVEKTISS